MATNKSKAVASFLIFILIITLMLIVVLIMYFLGEPEKPVPNTKTSTEISVETSMATSVISSDLSSEQPNPVTSGKQSDWNLILVNLDTPSLKSELKIEKAKFDGEFIDARAKQAYIDMCNAAKDDGITLYLRSGFREIALQQKYYDTSVSRYLDAGKSKEEAIELTLRYYAYPGKSEHHTGLALDIITPEYHNEIHTLDERFAETKAFKWLTKNCADYGFILRYPADKVELTKIFYEPWHYRYVGVESAQYMTNNNLCLEEYLSLLPK